MSPTGGREDLKLHDVGLNTVLVKQRCRRWITLLERNSRLNKTLNLMTLDNQRQAWATCGLSDQFRHIVYAKGALGKCNIAFL
jgi:hypothetical protein